MGRKPLLTAAGTLLTSLVLAGCQSSSPPRPVTGPTYPSGGSVTAQNNTTNNASSSTMATNAGLPYSPTGQATVSTQQPNGQFAPVSAANQPGNQFGQPYQPTRPTVSPTSGAFAAPANPTPVLGPQQPLSTSSQMPSTSSLGSSFGSQNLNPAPLNVNANVMNATPASSQAFSNSPPSIGAVAQSPPMTPMAGPPGIGMVDISPRNTSYPAPPSPVGGGFATQQ
jgi:hypothetical protein